MCFPNNNAFLKLFFGHVRKKIYTKSQKEKEKKTHKLKTLELFNVLCKVRLKDN